MFAVNATSFTLTLFAFDGRTPNDSLTNRSVVLTAAMSACVFKVMFFIRFFSDAEIFKRSRDTLLRYKGVYFAIICA